MQNNNETNENISRVVAEFFKKKPRQQSPRPHGSSSRDADKRHGKYNRRSEIPGKDEKENFRGSTDIQFAAESHDSDGASQTHKHSSKNKHKNNNRYNKQEKKPAVNSYKTDSAPAAVPKEASVNEDAPCKPGSDSCRNKPTDILPETKEKAENAAQTNEWYDPEAPIEIVGVRFQSGGKVYYFAPNGISAEKGENIIVETARGLEFGTVQIPNTVVKAREIVLPLKSVVRLATPDDIKRNEENKQRVTEAMQICNEKIAQHNLDMKLVDVEFTFDNSKLLFYFTSDGRVDFRELVKDLAAVFKTRIELRQIGIREETKLLGGIGVCGLPYCCKSFLTDFVQVSIKMAKEQGLSLNSSKISGACGRLMCCLRYEYETYDEEIRKTPKVDTPVITPEGPGVVCETQPLAGLCKVKLNDGTDNTVKVFHRDDLKRYPEQDDKDSSSRRQS